jgi:hypothetical protein
MKTLGYILLLAGFAMLIFRGIQYTQKEKVVDTGPLEISIKEKKTFNWPYYAGAVAIVAGIVLVLAGRRKR